MIRIHSIKPTHGKPVLIRQTESAAPCPQPKPIRNTASGQHHEQADTPA